jgi:hypothetical protein
LPSKAKKRRMNEPEEFIPSDDPGEPQQSTVLRPRVVFPPRTEETMRHGAQFLPEDDDETFAPPEPRHAAEKEPPDAQEFPAIQRAAGILRTALPFLQRLLPLLDGNVATAVANLLGVRGNSQSSQSSSRLDLTPIQEGLAELRSQQHSLRMEATEQNISLKRVEDQLETLRAVTSRNILEQQEVLEDMKALGNRIKWMAVIALLLAAASFAMTVALFLRFKNGLP